MRRLSALVFVGLLTVVPAVSPASAAKLGPPIQIGTSGSGINQPTIANLGSNGFVVAWTTFIGYAAPAPFFVEKTYAVHHQRFTTAGVPVGAEVVETITDYTQPLAKVAGLADRGFVIFVHGQTRGAVSMTVFRYAANGASNGIYRSTIDAPASGFDIAGLPNGAYVTTWTGRDGIYAQRHSAVSHSAIFKVSTTTGRLQNFPAVTRLTDGGFVIAWMSYRKNSTDFSIYGQRYHSDGTRAGGEFKVVVNNDTSFGKPSIAGVLHGGFVVGYRSAAHTYARLYKTDGNPAGNALRVDPARWPGTGGAVAGLTNAGFVVLFGCDDSHCGQRFTGAGARYGGPFKVTPSTAQSLAAWPSVRSNGNGFVVLWLRTSTGIFVQRYGP